MWTRRLVNQSYVEEGPLLSESMTLKSMFKVLRSNLNVECNQGLLFNESAPIFLLRLTVGSFECDMDLKFIRNCADVTETSRPYLLQACLSLWQFCVHTYVCSR
jgi:hypothetical protein